MGARGKAEALLCRTDAARGARRGRERYLDEWGAAAETPLLPGPETQGSRGHSAPPCRCRGTHPFKMDALLPPVLQPSSPHLWPQFSTAKPVCTSSARGKLPPLPVPGGHWPPWLFWAPAEQTQVLLFPAAGTSACPGASLGMAALLWGTGSPTGSGAWFAPATSTLSLP